MARTRLKPWTQSQSPARRTGETNTLPGWTEGNFPRIDPRPDASPRWPNRSPLWTASCISASRQASCSGACPSLKGASSFETFTRAYAATTQRHTPSWGTRSARASTGPLRPLMPARSCALVKSASFMPARLTSLRTPSRQSPSHGPLSHLILQGKPNASHVCAKINLHTHDRQNECNTIAVTKRTRVKEIQYSLLHSEGWTRRSKHKR
jgi:hypothetical protein